ncbi:FecR protein [Daejeonella rubra]|uniref:FecR protein n=1 Tax=Daejeonella rubra TaxID=990371 RepID=A0A1G9SJU8_9SPHI|nr:FecR family protein [Daejeonella rubra]SDM35691.1 FecR protein [Daejeonella rubra]
MKPFSSEERYQELAEKWLNNTITQDEREEFAQWYNSGQDKDINLSENYVSNEKELEARIYSEIDSATSAVDNPSFFRTYRWYSVASAAAIIAVIFSITLYFYTDTKQIELFVSKKIVSKPSVEVTKKANSVIPFVKSELLSENDIEPGDDKAILTLGDGTKIILDDAQNGVLANQGGNSILKTSKGELIYSFSKDNGNQASVGNTENVIFNTIQTPKGGKFLVMLPDGSKVWLNAASSLRFPTKFEGTKREVELQGEAYFEVAHDESKIFEVNTRNQTVQVLGTHFNINAYEDEPSVNTTLLEGSVRISDMRSNISQMLKPGEQAKVSQKIEVVNVKDTGEAVAWKDGYFHFNDEDIQTVMRQIERWYDVTVIYEGKVPSNRFGGEIERSLSLLQVLKILEKSKVHFRLEGREVIVMP